MTHPHLTLAAALLLSACAPEPPPRAADGDTIILHRTHIRLAGIDAPEYFQLCYNFPQKRWWPCGRVATYHLESLMKGRRVLCARTTTDHYGRPVAFCTADGIDLNGRMVRDGLALAYVRYSRAYVKHEALARSDRLGIWSGQFEPPEHYRQRSVKR